MDAAVATACALGAYVLLLFADAGTALGALAPVVNEDMTIQAPAAASAQPVITAIWVAVLASVLAAIFGYVRGRRSRSVPMGRSALFVLLGPLFAYLVLVIIGAYLERLPGWSVPWWTGVFPESDFRVPVAIAMLIPAVVASVAMRIGSRERGSAVSMPS